MKKTITVGMLAFASMGFSQEVSTENYRIPRNELKLNLVYAFWGVGEVSYERHLNENLSAGISAAAGFGKLDVSYGFTPYVRYYFGKNPNSGFFVEGNGMLVWSKDHVVLNESFQNSGERKKSFGIGMGAAVGYKYVTQKNIVFEAYGGVGKFFNNELSDGVYPRFGIGIGKKF